MQITIGELTSELTKYSNLVETSMVGPFPFTRAYLSTLNGFTKLYLYIIQTKDGIYSVCADDTDANGARFFPTGNISKPFIREVDKIHKLFGGKETADTDALRKMNNLDYYAFMNYLYQLLMDNDMVKVTSEILDTKLVSIGFNNMKIHRAIEKGFAESNTKYDTIGNLVTIVNKKRLKFPLADLRAKDIECVTGKLADNGIIAHARGNDIVDITFARR